MLPRTIYQDTDVFRPGQRWRDVKPKVLDTVFFQRLISPLSSNLVQTRGRLFLLISMCDDLIALNEAFQLHAHWPQHTMSDDSRQHDNVAEVNVPW